MSRESLSKQLEKLEDRFELSGDEFAVALGIPAISYYKLKHDKWRKGITPAWRIALALLRRLSREDFKELSKEIRKIK